ncbi:MAG: LytTR family DNA-binding domain-containing protein [Ruminiclostridium sp.]|nr:LytTR family DNA-binding domain-containing protein [Ruminiclostridium sp.]
MEKKLSILICDYDKHDVRIIEAMAREWLVENEREADVTVFTDPVRFRETFISGTAYDIYLLGVSMHGSSGIELGKLIHSRYPNAPLIYVTRSKGHALDAFSVNALRYILKPVNYMEFVSALDFAYIVHRAVPRNMVTVRMPGAVTSLNEDDVVYIENNVRSMKYVMKDGEIVNGTRRNISFENFFAPLLSSGKFVQPHKSFIVNLNYISSMRTSSISLSTGVNIPISRRHITEVHEAYEKFNTK